MNISLFKSAIPVLVSLDIHKTVEFYCSVLGFSVIYEEPGVYGIVQRDDVQIHFWASSDKYLAENTGCRISVQSIDALYAEYQPKQVIHPNAPLQEKPWGTREFAILDQDGNLITFFERL